MIPPRFFWLLDAIVITFAFGMAHVLTPSTLNFFAPGGALRSPWIEAVFSPSPGILAPWIDLVWVWVVAMSATLLTLAMLGGHQPLLFQSRTRILLSSFGAPFVGLSIVVLILFAFKNFESRIFIFAFALLSGLGLYVCRSMLRSYFFARRDAGFYAKNVLLIGLPNSMEWMTEYFSNNIPPTEYALCGYLRIGSGQVYPNLLVKRKDRGIETETPVFSLGLVEELGELLIRRPIHEVIATSPSSDSTWLMQVIRDCDYFNVLLRIVPEALLFGGMRGLKTLYPFEALNLPAVVLAPPHWDSDALFLKRLFDIVVSAALLFLFSPLFALVALAIKITAPQLPVFYRWHVVGKNGAEFTGYKFTTMVADADARKAELVAQNEMEGPVFKIKNDPRMTPLGRFLRKYSINELPQLWSVLAGDMSLVGPRPAFRHELERYEFWHKRKLSIRPGITCLWQVRGRNKIKSFDDWVRMDLEYIDHWSLWLDFKILVWTVRAVLRGTGS